MYSNLIRINLAQGALKSFYISTKYFGRLTSSFLMNILDYGKYILFSLSAMSYTKISSMYVE